MDTYELNLVRKAADIQELIASAQGIDTELDGKPSNEERPAVDNLLEMLSDVWELAEDFVDNSEWVKPLKSIDNLLGAMNRVGWQLYGTLIERSVTNPLTGKYEAIKVVLVVASKQNTEKLELPHS